MSTCENPSRGSYVSGCRCDGCRKANTAYENSRARADFELKLIPADPVREHVERLHVAGWSNRQICRFAKINRSALSNLISHHWRTGRPIESVRKTTADRILAIEPTKPPINYDVRLDADGFIKRITWLSRHGVTLTEIAHITGISYATLVTRKSKTQITAKTAKRLMDNWGDLKTAAEWRTRYGRLLRKEQVK